MRSAGSRTGQSLPYGEAAFRRRNMVSGAVDSAPFANDEADRRRPAFVDA